MTYLRGMAYRLSFLDVCTLRISKIGTNKVILHSDIVFMEEELSCPVRSLTVQYAENRFSPTIRLYKLSDYITFKRESTRSH